MTPHAPLRWLDCQEASERLNASRSRFLVLGVNLVTWGILGAFLGLFWYWVWMQIH